MWEDPIVAEVHRAREKLAADCNYDVEAFFAGLRKRQASLGDKLVSPKKRAEPHYGLIHFNKNDESVRVVANDV